MMGAEMKAMVLGRGTRGRALRPLTNDRPKALVEIAGAHACWRLRLAAFCGLFGIREVIVNVHHFADMVVEYLKVHGSFRNARLKSSREERVAGYRRGD